MRYDREKFISFIAYKDKKNTVCTVQFSPNGKKYKVKCPPKEVFGKLVKQIDDELARRERKLELLRRKRKQLLEILWSGPKGVVS